MPERHNQARKTAVLAAKVTTAAALVPFTGHSPDNPPLPSQSEPDYRLYEASEQSAQVFGLAPLSNSNITHAAEPHLDRSLIERDIRDLEEQALLSGRSTWSVLGLISCNSLVSIVDVLNAPDVDNDGLICISRLRLYGYIRNDRGLLQITQRGTDLLMENGFLL